MSKKIIITESQFKYIVENHVKFLTENELTEFQMTSHAEIERLKQRFLNVDYFNIKLFTEPFKIDDKPIGKWLLPENVRTDILDKLEFLKKFHIPGRKTASYGIIIHDFNIKPLDCEYKNEKDRDQALLYVGNKSPLMVSDPETNSIGDIMLAVIENDAVVSIMYERTHKGLNDIVSRKKQKYYNFKEIKSWYDYVNASISDKKGEKIRKNFNYNQGTCYGYEDLKNLHDDIDVQFTGMNDNLINKTDKFDGYPDDYNFCYRILTAPEIKAQYRKIKLIDVIRDENIQSLINTLRMDGLDKPPIGFSGEDVASAFVLMNTSMPYFDVRDNKSNSQ